jgi:hypothetical protein
MNMRAFKTSAIKTDMILAKSVYDLQGVMLLKKGHRLTAKNILMLKSWGVPQVWIKAQQDTDPDDLSERQKSLKNKIKQQLDRQFSAADRSPVMAEIKRVAEEILLIRELNKGRDHDTD